MILEINKPEKQSNIQYDSQTAFCTFCSFPLPLCFLSYSSVWYSVLRWIKHKNRCLFLLHSNKSCICCGSRKTVCCLCSGELKETGCQVTWFAVLNAMRQSREIMDRNVSLILYTQTCQRYNQVWGIEKRNQTTFDGQNVTRRFTDKQSCCHKNKKNTFC